MMSNVAMMLLATGLLSALLVGVYLALARSRGVLDLPNERSSHARPTPTGAGLAFIATLIAMASLVGFEPATSRLGPVALPMSWAVLLAGGAILCLVGLLDDVRGLPAIVRLVVQLVVALTLVIALPVPGPLSATVFLVLLVGTMNAYNFMDGSNGMAAAQAVVSGLFLLFAFLNAGETALALAAATVAGAALGFLPWNFPLARVFMGDAGSVPLGCLLGGLCLAAFATGALPGTSALLILAVFYTDAGLTLLGRFWRGERWYTAHRKHAYQRLIAQGWTHGQVLFMYVALNFAVVAPAVITSVWRPELSVAVTVGAYGLLALLWGAVSLKLGEGP